MLRRRAKRHAASLPRSSAASRPWTARIRRRFPRWRSTGTPRPSISAAGVASPALVFAAQGAKRVVVGGQAYDYDHLHCLVTSVDLPMTSQVTRASSDAPYLCVKLALDPQCIA